MVFLCPAIDRTNGALLDGVYQAFSVGEIVGTSLRHGI